MFSIETEKQPWKEWFETSSMLCLLMMFVPPAIPAVLISIVLENQQYLGKEDANGYGLLLACLLAIPWCLFWQWKGFKNRGLWVLPGWAFFLGMFLFGALHVYFTGEFPGD